MFAGVYALWLIDRTQPGDLCPVALPEMLLMALVITLVCLFILWSLSRL
jgi:hypothetical protein